MKNQSRDAFLSNTKKNLKDCMTITLRSGKKLKGSKEAEKKQIDEKVEDKDQNSSGSEKKQSRNGLSYEKEQLKEQGEVAKEETV